MQAYMIATTSGNVQLDWLRDVISEIEVGAEMTSCIFDDELNCITTPNSGNFQTES
jgi:hypothetical protein